LALPLFVKTFFCFSHSIQDIEASKRKSAVENVCGKCLDSGMIFHLNGGVISKGTMNPTFRYISQLHEKNPRLSWAICLIVLLALIVAGLWPFNFRAKNKVIWLEHQNGIHFYGQGLIVSSDIHGRGQMSPFPDKSITLEIWLRPLLETVSLPHILTLYDSKSPELFVVGQWKSHLVIRSRIEDPVTRNRDKPYREIGLQNGLLKDQDTFITITSGTGGTAVHVNGKKIQSYPNYNMLAALTDRPLRFILGNSPTGESFWTGNIMGFAIYNRVLTTDQVFKSYQTWIGKAPPFASTDGRCMKMYPFDEGKGKTIHNAVDFNDALVIPEIFKPVQRKTLSPIRQGLRWNFSYAQDVMINVLGFIPFGFFFSALLMKTARHKRLLTSVAIVILGIGLSLAIEISQTCLPTRTSSLTDVVMNAIGTILGAAIFQIQIKTISKPE
jgi:hypothetical protein